MRTSRPEGEVNRMHCRRCDLTVADIWRWCPECGGEVGEEDIDLTKPPFVLGWYGEYTYLLTEGAT
jgi:hypothetical protein